MRQLDKCDCARAVRLWSQRADGVKPDEATGDGDATGDAAANSVIHPLSLIARNQAGELIAAAICQHVDHGGRRVDCVTVDDAGEQLRRLIDKAAFKLRAGGVNTCRFRLPDGSDPLRECKAARWPKDP